MKKSLFIFFLIAISFSYSEPENLAKRKKEIRNYYQSGEYDKEINRIIDSAITEVNKIKIEDNSAFVFDIDETALSNMSYEKNFDYGFNPSSWNIWIDSAKAPAIPAVKRFYDYLTKVKVKIIFITGRSFDQLEKTKENLEAEHYVKFDTLICKSKEFVGKKAIEYKTSIRKSLSVKYNIIGSIGDQYSDIEGGYAPLKIKIPNPMYWID